MPDKLPTGWTWARFDDVFQVASDGGRRLPQGEYAATGKYPVIDQGEKDPGGYTDEELVYEGELPVILFGDHTRRFKLIEQPFVVGAQGVKILRPAREVPVRFLWLAVNGLKIESRGYSRHFQFLKKASIPLAPLPEQERIVAKLDALLSRVAAGEAAARRALERLKRYRAAVLHAAVTGELTRDSREKKSALRTPHPAFESGQQLLKRLLQERRARWEAAELKRFHAAGKSPKDDKWKKRYKEPALPGVAAPSKLPSNWTWISLGQLAWSVKDGPHFSPKYSPRGVPFITGGNVRPSGVDFESAKRISQELHKEFSKRCKPEVGDILYTKGGTTGIARVNTYSKDFSVWVHVAVLKLVGSVEPFFVQHALNSPSCYAQSQRYTHGVGNQDLGLTRMVKIALPLPPLFEQRAIVTEVDRRLDAADRLEEKLSRQLQRAQVARQSLLREAFAGNLVPQDQDDEPASVLLDRIRAARDAEAKKPRAKRMPKPKLKSVETLEQLEELIHKLGKGATPEQILLAAGLGDDVELFFDLLRAGRDKGSLIVPIGKGTAIRRAQHAN